MTTRLGLGASILVAPATATWATPFAAYYLLLQHRVIQQRIKGQVALGDHSDAAGGLSDPLFLAIRSQANFIENVPLAMLMALLAEINGADRRLMTYALGALFAVRVAHVEMGMLSNGGKGKGRLYGYVGTQAFFAAVAGYTAYLVKDYWIFW